MVVKITTDVQSRKARRKQERRQKKKRNRPTEEEEDPEPSPIIVQKPPVKKAKKTQAEKAPTVDANDPYAHLDPSIASALRAEDAEIAELEEKLGLGKKKDKSRLNKEYAKLEGYGDDFGDFLDDLDTMVSKVARGGSDDEDDNNEPDYDRYQSDDFDEDDDSEPDEELVPMKGSPIQDDDDSIADGMEDGPDSDSDGNQDREFEDDNGGDSGSEDGADSDSCEGSGDEENSNRVEPDHDTGLTYKPSSGEDIYGKSTEETKPDTKPGKYVPPHLRNKQDSEDREEKLRTLKRLLNNAMNRLSEDTLISVAQQVAKIYQAYPTADVNEYLWKNVFSAAVDRPIVMATMIPVYVGCLVGVHLQSGDTVQLGGYLMEHIVTKLMSVRNKASSEDESKEAANLMLCVCYLYNYGLVHSAFMFDVVRSLIEVFSEQDIELILLILSHCGHALRSDDPLALKEIVLSVQKRDSRSESSSRVEYMISAMTDLKNNKRRKQDMVYSERTTKIRKFLGRIKSEAYRSADSSCLRIRLQDILDVETKGRWWKVGASWVGNQFKHEKDGNGSDEEGTDAKHPRDEEEEELLKLASKYRMNTDSRRSIFCIIMGSADCDDAFEKLVRAGLLKNRTERDCVRVLVECCGNEGNYNPFYSHLASRICDYQPQCKFTFQLAFWDIFKQWDTVKHRKAANLAKLLYHLVVVHQSLRLGILKTLDIAELEESALIFLTVFFSTMFESIDDPSTVVSLFERGIPRPRPDQKEDGEGLRHSLSVFFLQTLKSSPKNKKKSQFRANLKVAIKACETDELHAVITPK